MCSPGTISSTPKIKSQTDYLHLSKFSKDWKHIERVLQYPLPALPTPTIVKVPRDVHSLVYQQAGRSYRLPQANGFIFTSEGLDFNHFLKIWIYLNKRNMETIIVKEVQAALRSFAHQGFPDAHKLTKRLLKLVSSSLTFATFRSTAHIREISSIHQTNER